MSKKCCGFIYSDEDKICRICGNPLVDEDFMNSGTGRMSDMDILISSLSGNLDTEMSEGALDEYENMADVPEDYNENKAASDIPEEYEMTEAFADEMEDAEEDADGEIYEYNTSAETEPEQYVVDMFAQEDNKMDVLDEIEAEEQAIEDAKIKPGEEKAPTSMKVVGIVSVILAVLTLAMAGVFVYFMVIKPSYDKTGESLKQMIYPEIATSGDVDLATPRDYISTVPLATGTDYTVYEPVEPEIKDTDATVTDAMTEEEGVVPESDVVE